MKLKQTILQQLLTNRTFRLRLAVDLNFSEVWIDKLIDANKNNGTLTTAKALQVIREETGLADSEILEEVVPEVKEA